MSSMMVLLYMVVMFLIGAVGTFILILYLFGSFARTVGLGHMFGNKIALYPLEDRTMRAKKIKNVDEKGRWTYETDDGRHRKLRVRPKDIMIEGGKCPTAMILPGSAVSTSPQEAYAVDKTEGEGEEIEIWGESFSFNSIRNKLGDIFNADHYAGIIASSMEGNKPLTTPESEGIDKGTVFKLGGIATVVVIIIVAIYVVTNMGLI